MGCLFCFHGGGFNEIAVLDRMAFDANLPVRVLTVESGFSTCQGSVY